MGSRQRKVRERYGRRPFETRPPLPIVTIVCDDTKTAVAYFTQIKREVKAKVTVRVEPARDCGAHPKDVLTHARELAEDPERNPEEGDSIWVLIDTEAEASRQEEARQAKQRAEGTKVQVLLSKPCYEVWTLAHFLATGEAFADCGAVVNRVKREWEKRFGVPFPRKKGQADYGKLMPLRADAVKHARMRNPDKDPSWTEVHNVVEAIDQLAGSP